MMNARNIIVFVDSIPEYVRDPLEKLLNKVLALLQKEGARCFLYDNDYTKPDREIGDLYSIMLIFSALESLSPDDQEYMLKIYEQFKHLMFNAAYKYTSNPHMAEDLVQDSLAKLIPKAYKLRELDRCALSAYVVYTVKNTAKNHLRHLAVESQHIIQSELEDYCESISDTDPTPEELLLISERKEDFFRVWDRLSDEDKDILRGKYILELSDKELAKQLSCKPSSIRMKLTRARRRALNLLKEVEFTYDEA